MMLSIVDLPEPLGPDDREHLALLDRQVDAVEGHGGRRAVAAGDAPQLHDRGAHLATTTLSPSARSPPVTATRPLAKAPSSTGTSFVLPDFPVVTSTANPPPG